MICLWSRWQSGRGDETVKGVETDTLGKTNEQYSGEGRGDCKERNHIYADLSLEKEYYVFVMI